MTKFYWNVFYENPNKGIEIWNVFRHASFQDEVKLALATEKNKEQFEKRLHSAVMYYFWSKSEYEVIVAPWPCYITRFESEAIRQTDLPRYRQLVNVEGSEKFSIYDQLELNWDAFVNYCWELRNEEI